MKTREEKQKELKLQKIQIELVSDASLIGENMVTDVLYHAEKLKVIVTREEYNCLLEALIKLVKKYEFNMNSTQRANIELDEEYIESINVIKKATDGN